MGRDDGARSSGHGMRSVTAVITPPGTANPAYRLFDTGSELVRERVFQTNVLDDGTMILLGRVRGDVESIEDALATWEDVLAYSVSETDGAGAMVYVHTDPPSAVKEFLELPRAHEVFIEYPVEGTPDGKLRVTLVGETNEILQRALADVPEDFAIEIVRIGPYSDASESVRGVLTDRQLEVLDTAVELGYYEVPRRATHRDIADRMGLSVGTVGEHLQKIESRVLGGVAGHERG